MNMSVKIIAMEFYVQKWKESLNVDSVKKKIFQKLNIFVYNFCFNLMIFYRFFSI